MDASRAVVDIALTPVRTFHLDHPREVELGPHGVATNRRFFLVDGEGNRLRSSLTSWPVALSGTYETESETLSVHFPDGRTATGSALELTTPITVVIDDRSVPARMLDGPWNDGLSQLAGHPVRIARTDQPGDALVEPVTLVSEASVERLAREVGHPVDGRRFRMLFTLSGFRAHEEDEWEGRLLRIGDAVVRVGGPVPRCAVTTRDPDTGERDLDTLRLIKGYRGVRDGDAIDFGVYGRVEQPGRVRLGDPVELA